MRHLSVPVGRIAPIVFLVVVPAITQIIIPFPLTIFGFIGPLYYFLTGPRSIEKYLKQGLEQAVIEYETLKKITIVTLSIYVFPLTFALAYSFLLYPQLTGDFLFEWGRAIGILWAAGTFGLITYVATISKREFRFSFAKVCFIMALSQEDIFNQMRFFDKGLREYNKYLKRHLKHQIKDIDKVFSKVSLLDNDAKSEVIRTLSNSFGNETDKLKPLKSISSGLMNSEDTESLSPRIPEIATKGNRYVFSSVYPYHHLYNYTIIT